MLSWLWSRIRGAFNRWVEGLILVGTGIAILALWRARDELPEDVTLPTWLFAFVIGVPSVLALLLLVRAWRGGGASPVTVLQRQLVLSAYYSKHIYDALETLQKILTGTIPGVSVETFIEQGVLQPARDFLMQRQGEDVRLSILVPDGQDFIMLFAAGHTLESKQRFRLPIAASFSRSAYETGDIQWSGDLENDARFTRHPRAAQERAYNSIISLPVRSGDHTVGVFNVISTYRDAFEPADFIYVTLLGAITDVVWSGTGGITENGHNVDNSGTDK